VDLTLDAAYARCREIHRRHGRTYFLATRLLPRWKRRHVHALYGFTRYADDIVDHTGREAPSQRAERLRDWSDRFFAGLHGDDVDDPILPAVFDTIAAFDLDRADFASFLASMAMDLQVTHYQTYGDLLTYMEGSAAVIGTMMLPILGSADPEAAREPARQLGLAFQLTNFIRDIAEDLDRGRVYLPLQDLEQFGISLDDLRTAGRARQGTSATRRLVEFEIERAREHYAAAAPGIPMLDGRSQTCMRTAFHLYGGILDRVASAGHDPFVRRAVVSNPQRISMLIRSMRTPYGAPVRQLEIR
jgi:phytoene synthase